MFELASNPIGYFGKMNSTLGSAVPLAMFVVAVESLGYPRISEKVKRETRRRRLRSTQRRRRTRIFVGTYGSGSSEL